MKKWGKIVAVVLVIAIVFGIWQGPIKSRADKLANEDASGESVEKTEDDENISGDIHVDESEIVNKFTLPCGDDEKSYVEYVTTNTHIICTYYKYVGEDEDGNPIYEKKASKSEIMPEISEDDLKQGDAQDQNNRNNISRGESNTRDEGSPLYWQKIVRENLKKVYYYQVGVKGEDVYYRIGGEQSVAVNYSKLNEAGATDVKAFIDQVDLVNKQLVQCILVAIGAVMMAISVIIASYVAVGSTICSTLIAPILKQFGVQLISLSPIGFGQMVFKMYDDYQDLKEMYCQAATHGSIFTP